MSEGESLHKTGADATQKRKESQVPDPRSHDETVIKQKSVNFFKLR